MDYKTYHYTDEEVNDCGWGCSYRNIQTIISCYKRYYNSEIIIPNILHIIKYFRKNIYTNNLTDLWIEPFDIYTYLKNKNNIDGYNCIYVINDTDISNILKTDIIVYLEHIYNDFKDIYNLIINHFNKTQLPVIIDDGTYSYCIIYSNNELFLIDPHICNDNNIKKINFTFLEKSFWMIYFPQITI